MRGLYTYKRLIYESAVNASLNEPLFSKFDVFIRYTQRVFNGHLKQIEYEFLWCHMNTSGLFPKESVCYKHKHGGIPLKQYTTTSYRDKYIQDQMHEITSRGSEIDPLTNLQYKHLVAPG